MKTTITSKWSIAVTALAVFVSACGSNVSVSKRYHSGGFNISWGGGDDAAKTVAKSTTKKPVIKKVGKAAVNSEEVAVNSQETVTFNGVYAQAASKVTNENGIPSTTTETGVMAEKSLKTSKTDVTKAVVAAKPAVKAAKSSSGPGKSQIIALVLALLVGVIGIHRFYLGYPMEGVLQIITLGGCGIWTLIDIVRIITGDLQPADGEYEETL
jgi:TM2 domain-containing membrane protein YozV